MGKHIEAPVHQFEIKLLGPVQILADGASVKLRSTERRLLALLALNAPASVSTDRIADGIYGDDLPERPANAIRFQISQLRGKLGGRDVAPIVTSGAGYALGSDRVDVDLKAFEELCSKADRLREADPAAAWRMFSQALDMWDGPEPLQDVADAPFAVAEVPRLVELRLTAIERRLESALRIGKLAEAVGELRSLLADHPDRERLWGLYMQSLYLDDRQAEALSAYAEVSDLFAEKGLEVPPELQLLEDRILTRDLEPETEGVRMRSNVPADVSSFIGRGAEVDEIRQLIEDDRLVTLTGPGGIGKTRLAIRVAQLVADEYPHGTWLVALGASGADDPLGREVARQLGVQEHPPAPVLHTVCDWFGDERALLVLDNCEHVVEQVAEAVQLILSRCPHVRVLTTSRTPIRISGEQVLAVPPLSLLDTGEGPSDAVRMLDQRAAAVGHGDVAEHVAEAAEICERVGGIPLAIELAAARLRVFGWRGLLAKLDDVFGVLTQEQVAPAPHQRTLSATMAWSYSLLDDPSRALFRQLSVFRGGFTLDAAAVVCGESMPGDAPVAVVLADLVDASLVAASESDPPRYSLLEPIRQYAELELQKEGELDAAWDRHAAHYLDRAVMGSIALAGPDRMTWLVEFDCNHKNFLAALDRTVGGHRDEAACALVTHLHQFWLEHGHLREGLEWIRKVQHLGVADPVVQADLHRMAAFHEFWMGDLDAADVDIGRALDLAESLDATTQGTLLHQRGNIVGWGRGRPADAIPLFEQALDLYALDDSRTLSAKPRSQVTVAYLYVLCGRSDAANRIVEEVEAFGEMLGGMDLIDHSLDQIRGWAAFHGGDLDAAAAHLRSAHEGFKAMGMKPLHSATAYNLAWTELYRDDLSAARALIDESMATVWERGGRLREAHGLETLARISLAGGDAAAASELVEQSLEVSTDRHDIEAMMWASLTGAEIARIDHREELAAAFAGHAGRLQDLAGVTLPKPVIDGAPQRKIAHKAHQEPLRRALQLLESVELLAQ